jgi:superoxide dismutase
MNTITAKDGKPDKVAIFNQAVQTGNHAFFWSRMPPQWGGEPPAGSGPLTLSPYQSPRLDV